MKDGVFIVILKSIDLSLIAEHLTAHKGVLNKLESYYCAVQNTTLKQIIYEQYLIMWNHVKVMMLLMDPEINEEITAAFLNKVEPVAIQCQGECFIMKEQNIALELGNTAKTMAHANFSSALMMKAHNVRDIHIHMALQQSMLQHRYNEFSKETMMEIAPKSSLKEQTNTLKSFKRMFKKQD